MQKKTRIDQSIGKEGLIIISLVLITTIYTEICMVGVCLSEEIN